MKIYEKPLMAVESLFADVQLANDYDVDSLGEIDLLDSERGEVSITAPEGWLDY